MIARHRQCGGVAFRIVGPMVEGGRIMAENIRLANGEPPAAGEPMRCESCGAQVSLHHQILDWEPDVEGA